MRLPRISGKAAVRALEQAGFVQCRQRGSHVILKKITATGARVTVVPLHDELDRGTLLEIIRQAGMTKEAFLGYC
jgi:predicted RNA binding protein YcfA (HicA-like mRNA interferase family)